MFLISAGLEYGMERWRNGTVNVHLTRETGAVELAIMRLISPTSLYGQVQYCQHPSLFGI